MDEPKCYLISMMPHKQIWIFALEYADYVVTSNPDPIGFGLDQSHSNTTIEDYRNGGWTVMDNYSVLPLGICGGCGKPKYVNNDYLCSKCRHG
jgi:hypothetical protein